MELVHEFDFRAELREQLVPGAGPMGTRLIVNDRFRDQYFLATPRLEAGDDRDALVNTTLFVAEGRVTETGVEYRVFRVT